MKDQPFSRKVPQVKYGPGMNVRLNAAGKRVFIKRVKRMRSEKNRTYVVFMALLTGALSKRDVDENAL